MSGYNSSFGFLFLIAFLASLPSSSTQLQEPTYIYHVCPNTTTYLENSTYSSNLKTLLSSLSSNNPSFSSGFYSTAAGRSPDVVFGLFLCRGDVLPQICRDCIVFAVNDTLSRCPEEKKSLIWYDECMLRYSDENFFLESSLQNGTNGIILINTQNVTSNQQDIFRDLVLSTMNQAANEAANSTRKFDARKADIPDSGIYKDDITTAGSLQFDFKAIEAATDKFSQSNKLGQGGFGEVYKGTFPSGVQVAVKRLSKTSGQGEREFENEVVVVAKLQHRNLVKLLGYCLEGEEKILVYEFVPNKSLDYFLFDSTMQSQLDWTRRYKIIGGIARGILYLHQDSRLTIIHRDLKAGNILLDGDMNPKIADFGMARIFDMDQIEANTRRVVGTYGYMSPEYAMYGQFSMKSDVYSFGVLVLEIISGKKNSSLYQMDESVGNLVTYTWRLWSNGSPLELVDPSFGDNYQTHDITRCIHIALLCVQEDADDRPTMSAIVQMLTTSSIALATPKQPGFFFRGRYEQVGEVGSSMDRLALCSIDDASITSVAPR
ncbi:Serine-threonine/tyrosine-protein kinase catalytic domain [Arabidopsis thaliana x Arabidopsis arenosa]|uniref:Serine-threonine/tyrosine-protein kinase catalytic domain n=1 Tax=Arabidopsis thaliana x Arabidopsis arenosa TaxID=1240361 RepID=A0A8T1Y3Y5_9BRAS|nr:Serine-threonine/tyrosine-protein kinase catalytic domain [Arabidopsis thaliana x Arabidopsis arenosa]